MSAIDEAKQVLANRFEKAAEGSITIGWDHALGVEANHDAAARAFIAKLGWYGSWVRGAAPRREGNVYVSLARERNSGIRFPHPQAVDPLDVLIVRAP